MLAPACALCSALALSFLACPPSSPLDPWIPWATAAATYFTFAAIGVGAVVTIHAIVPETKGKTLEEIEALWQK